MEKIKIWKWIGDFVNSKRQSKTIMILQKDNHQKNLIFTSNYGLRFARAFQSIAHQIIQHILSNVVRKKKEHSRTPN